MQKLKLLAILSIAVFLLALINSRSEPSHREKIKLAFFVDLQQLRSDINTLREAASNHATKEELVEQFHLARKSFKSIESVIAYYDDTFYAQLNAPNITKTDKTSTQFLEVEPHGFQVIEELVNDADEANNRSEIVEECKLMTQVIDRIITNKDRFTFYDREIMESMQQEVIRINALGLTGFDSPVLRNSLPENRWALLAMASNLERMEGLLKTGEQKNKLQTTVTAANKAAEMLNTKDFNTFDRLNYIKYYLNPLFSDLVELQQTLGIETYSQTYGVPGVINENVKDLYAENLVNRFFFLLTATDPTTIS